MSGWIKVEKALLSDARFRRLVRNFDDCNAPELHTQRRVTLLLGALVQLWLQADEHIRDDDTMRATSDDIDHLVGIKHFADQMPADWLQIIDSDNVHLPDFLEHNGSSAKKRALTQKRVENYRSKVNGNASALHDPPPRNAIALPDQTRPDHTRPHRKTQSDNSRATRLPEDWQPSEELREYARALKLVPDRVLLDFREYWLAAPGERGRKARWDLTWRTWCRKNADRLTGADAPRRKTRFEQLTEGLVNPNEPDPLA
jgi:hypothetical protein